MVSLWSGVGIRQFLGRLAFTEWVFNTLEPRGLYSTIELSVGKGTGNIFYPLLGGAGKDFASSMLP